MKIIELSIILTFKLGKTLSFIPALPVGKAWSSSLGKKKPWKQRFAIGSLLNVIRRWFSGCVHSDGAILVSTACFTLSTDRSAYEMG